MGHRRALLFFYNFTRMRAVVRRTEGGLGVFSKYCTYIPEAAALRTDGNRFECSLVQPFQNFLTRQAWLSLLLFWSCFLEGTPPPLSPLAPLSLPPPRRNMYPMLGGGCFAFALPRSCGCGTEIQGHIALARAVFPEDTMGSKLDVLARLALWEAGLDYRHGTGHGAFVNTMCVCVCLCVCVFFLHADAARACRLTRLKKYVKLAGNG